MVYQFLPQGYNSDGWKARIINTIGEHIDCAPGIRLCLQRLQGAPAKPQARGLNGVLEALLHITKMCPTLGYTS